MGGQQQITQLLQAAADGDRHANDELFTTVYQELRKIARAHRNRWQGNPTLNTTALIGEAYLKLAKNDLATYESRTHFYATASKAMRQILISYAERAKAAKRGGDVVHVTLSELALDSGNTLDELLVINGLLEKLEEENPRHGRLFDCRVFGGMTIQETASVLGVSSATVKRDWTLLSAWVYREAQKGAAKLDESGRVD
ncbi:MAG: ECF-type sigma factor [Gammaproteobacteria bacterium]